MMMVAEHPDADAPVRSLVPGALWWRAAALGLTDEEMNAFIAQTLPPERSAAIQAKIKEAGAALAELPCPGVQSWMTTRRAMS